MSSLQRLAIAGIAIPSNAGGGATTWRSVQAASGTVIMPNRQAHGADIAAPACKRSNPALRQQRRDAEMRRHPQMRPLQQGGSGGRGLVRQVVGIT